MRKGKKIAGPKKLSYRLIERDSVWGQKLYQMLEDLVEIHHRELADAWIALAWNLSWKADVDGRVTLGKMKKASDLDRELAAYDFVMILRQEFFENLRVTDDQRRALIDHELCHGAVKHDDRGEPTYDERGRIVYRVRKHDLEEFAEIAERYGCWKKDLEAFAAALVRSRQKASPWVGYERLRDQLHAAGARIPLETIYEWTEPERRDAEVWALLQAELKKRHLDTVINADCPSHIRKAVYQPELPRESPSVTSVETTH